MRTFGLIGFPLSHSFSPSWFAEKFKKLGIRDAVYKAFPLESIDQLPELLKREPELQGLNVTIPYKEGVIPFLHELSEDAQAVGAVNTIHIRNGKLKGFNTDIFGFRQSLKPFLESRHESALILGTGGASKAVQYVLREIGIRFTLVSRGKAAGTLSYEDLTPETVAPFRLIVNCTPVGMFPEMNACPLPEKCFSAVGPYHLVVDLIYNPEETVLIKKCREIGALTLNGLTMLHQQAEESWRIWNS